MKIRQATGVIAWLLRRFDKWAICLPPFAIYVLPEYWFNRDLIRHEGRHWFQYERLGLLRFYWLYLWYTLRHGYWNNPLEVDARRHAKF